MRKVAIIGSGQSGLLAAHGLQQSGYEVTLYSDRTPDEWLNHSRPSGASCKFAMAQAYEKELGLDRWFNAAPAINGARVCLFNNTGKRILQLKGLLEHPAQAVDSRLQCYHWMQELEHRGSKIVYEKVTPGQVEDIAAENQLTIIATGKDRLRTIFESLPGGDLPQQPARNLAMLILDIGAPVTGFQRDVTHFRVADQIGEIFFFPFHHMSGKEALCVVIEAIPRKAFDRFQHIKVVEEAVSMFKKLAQVYLPQEYAAFLKEATICDENAWLTGSIVMDKKDPVTKIPFPNTVIPLGDAALLVDPIAAQGANLATKMSRHVVQAIRDRGEEPFSEDWVRSTYDSFYERHGTAGMDFTRLLLQVPESIKELLIAQVGSSGSREDTSSQQKIADSFCQAFNDPGSYSARFADLSETKKYISSITGKPYFYSGCGGRLKIMKGQIRQQFSRQSWQIL